MDCIQNLEKKREELFNFASHCERVFLYGAGNIAKAFIDVFKHENVKVEALITTKGEKKEFCGYQVFSAEQAKAFITKEDGVVLAFAGALYDEIYRLLLPASPQILPFDPSAILAMDDDICFRSIVERWNREFGEADVFDNRKKWNRILIVRLDLIGDLIFTTPFLRELRRNFPNSEITLVVRRQNYFLVKNCPYVSHVLLYDCPFQEGELSRQCEKIEEIELRARKFAEDNFAGEKYDVVFFPRELLAGRNVLDELLVGYLCGARTRMGKQIDLPDIYGQHLREITRDVFSFISLHKEPMHEAQYALKILEDCGLHVKDDSMELWVTEEDIKFAAGFICRGQGGKEPVRIALGIMASVDTRTWKAENYRDLIRVFYAKYGEKYSFVLMGGTDAIPARDVIYDGLKGERKITVDLTGKTNLAQSAACMQLCDLYVGSNTGLLHFASAFHKPSVTLYSWLADGAFTDGDSPYRMGAWKVPHIDLVPQGGLDGCHGGCRMRFSHCINLNTVEQVEQGILKLSREM